MKKKTKEKPKGKICPVLSKMFYIDNAATFSQRGKGSTIHNPRHELRTVTWHCEKDKCQWWIPEFESHTGALSDPIPLGDPKKTGLGWCGGAVVRGPAS